MLDYEKRLYPLMLIVIACIGALGLWSDGLSASGRCRRRPRGSSTTTRLWRATGPLSSTPP